MTSMQYTNSVPTSTLAMHILHCLAHKPRRQLFLGLEEAGKFFDWCRPLAAQLWLKIWHEHKTWEKPEVPSSNRPQRALIHFDVVAR